MVSKDYRYSFNSFLVKHHKIYWYCQLSHFDLTSSKTPIGYLRDSSANVKVILEGFRTPSPILSTMLIGMMLTLAPKSHKLFFTYILPTFDGMLKLPGSSSFGGNFLWIASLDSLDRLTTLQSSTHFLLITNSFKNFTKFGICFTASTKGISM